MLTLGACSDLLLTSSVGEEPSRGVSVSQLHDLAPCTSVTLAFNTFFFGLVASLDFLEVHFQFHGSNRRPTLRTMCIGSSNAGGASPPTLGILARIPDLCICWTDTWIRASGGISRVAPKLGGQYLGIHSPCSSSRRVKSGMTSGGCGLVLVCWLRKRANKGSFNESYLKATTSMSHIS